MTDFPFIQRFYGDRRMHHWQEREAEGARAYLVFILLFGLALLLLGLWTKITKVAPIVALGSVLALAACSSTGAASALGALKAIGMSRDAYCSLTPEARAKVRRELGLQEQWITCPNDRAASHPRPRRGQLVAGLPAGPPGAPRHGD